ncbi:MAG TPA: hypothetical protein VFA15_08430, partial [Nitrososphaera sp.]|nr:hypothetical protein [Nitrososphaera sp.]
MSEITYELNPPKIVKGERFDFEQLRLDLQAIIDKASRLSSLADSIHMTDSVLGIPRVSGITAAGYIRQELPEARISCSLRTRDRNFSALSQSVADAIFCGVERLLILLGDEPQDSPGNCGIKPSAAVRMFRKEGYDSNMRLD